MKKTYSLATLIRIRNLTKLKKEEKTTWFKEIHSQILEQALKDLDQSFQNFFRRVKQKQTPGYPRFKRPKPWSSFKL